MHSIQLDGKQTLAENIADNGGTKSAFRVNLSSLINFDYVKQYLSVFKNLFYKYQAYEKWKENNLEPEAKLPGLEKYTQDQMFFIGLSQPWCSLTKREALIQQIINDFHSVNEFRFERRIFSYSFFFPINL